MSFPLSSVRIIVYAILGVFSLILFSLTAARLHYTEHLKPNDPLNGGKHFYDPIVAELLFTSILSILWAIFAIHTIYGKLEFGLPSTFGGELVGLSILFLFLLVGAAKSSSIWGQLGFCHQYKACRILTTMVAFAWLSWLVVIALFGMSLMFSIANKAWKEPLHGRWDPRISHYHDRDSQNVGRPVSV